jgi:hypothetical protein
MSSEPGNSKPSPPPFSIPALRKKKRQGIPLTEEEHAYWLEYHSPYNACKQTIYVRADILAEWEGLAKDARPRMRGLSTWIVHRVGISLRPEPPEIMELRDDLRRTIAERDMLRGQAGELAVQLSEKDRRIRELETEARQAFAYMIKKNEEVKA